MRKEAHLLSDEAMQRFIRNGYITVKPEFPATFHQRIYQKTEEMFENSLKLIDECGLTWLHVFPFSARAGTPAARMPQTDGKITKKRATALRNLGKIQVAKHLKSEIGKRHNILIETPRTGRTEQFTEVLFDTNQIPGDIVKKKILGSVDSKLYV